MENEIISTALTIGSAILLIWFVVMRPLGAITEIPDLLEKFVEQLKALNIHLNHIAHQMSAIYIELRRLEEEGIALRRQNKTSELPFLEKENKPKDKSVSE